MLLLFRNGKMILWQVKELLYSILSIMGLGILIVGKFKEGFCGGSEARCYLGSLIWADQLIRWCIFSIKVAKYKLLCIKVFYMFIFSSHFLSHVLEESPIPKLIRIDLLSNPNKIPMSNITPISWIPYKTSIIPKLSTSLILHNFIIVISLQIKIIK